MAQQHKRRRLPQHRDMRRTSLQLPESILEAVKDEAEERGVSRSAVIVGALADKFGDDAVKTRLLPLLAKP